MPTYGMIFFAVLLLSGCHAATAATESRQGIPDRSLSVCQAKLELTKYENKTIVVHGFLFGGPHGIGLVSDFDATEMLMLESRDFDRSDPYVSQALSDGMFSWSDESAPWVHIDAVGVLRVNDQTGAVSLKLMEIRNIQYWGRVVKASK